MRRLLSLLLLLALAGCTAATSTKIEMTGDSIVSLATTFDTVSRHMTAQCIAKVYTVATCDAYRTFGEKFKASYPAAKTLWNSATQFEDKGLLAGASTALSKLSSDLAPFLAMMSGGK